MKINPYVGLLATTLFVQGCTNPTEKAENYIKSGKSLYEQKQYDKANLEFRNALQINNKLGEAFYYTALIEEQKQNWQAMFANLNQAVALMPKHADSLLKFAQLKLLSGQVDEALQHVETVLQDNPKNVHALTIKGVVFLKKGNQNEAIALADQALSLEANNADAVGLKAAIFMKDKNYDSALQLVSQSINEKSDPSLYLLKLQIHTELKDVNAQEQDFKELATKFSDNADFSYGLAKFYSDQGKDNESEAVLQAVIQKKPDDLKAKIVYLEFLGLKKPDQVLSKLQEFIKQQPDSAELYLRLAQAQFAKQQTAEAKTSLNWIIEHKKDDKIALNAKVILASMAVQEKNTAEADKLLNEVIAVDARHFDALSLKARMKLADDKLDDAINDLRGILRDYPNKDDIMITLAQAYLKQNSTELADETFHKALEVNPTNLQALTAVVAKALARKEIDRADEMVSKAFAAKPNSAELSQMMAQIKLLKKDWSGAQKLAETAGDAKNQVAGFSPYLAGKVLQGQEKWKEAIEKFQEALKVNPNLPDALNSLVTSYDKLKQPNLALTFIDEFLKTHPDANYAIGLKSRLLINNKKFDEAIALLNSAIQDKPKIEAFYEVLADVYQIQKKNDLVIGTLEKGLEVNPENMAISGRLATLYENAKQYEKAKTLYEKLIEKQPKNLLALNNLVSLLLDHFETPENLAKAAKLAEQLKDSQQPYLLDSYAWSLFKSNQIDDALATLKKVIETAPNVPVFHYHLGEVYAKKGDKELAKNEIKLALKLADKTAFVEKEKAEALLKTLN